MFLQFEPSLHGTHISWSPKPIECCFSSHFMWLEKVFLVYDYYPMLNSPPMRLDKCGINYEGGQFYYYFIIISHVAYFN